jgi:uncharacterized membrane protein YbhN (UPF0104 family)
MSNLWIQELIIILFIFGFIYLLTLLVLKIFNKKLNKKYQKIYWGFAFLLIVMVFIWGTNKRYKAREEQKILDEKLMRLNIIDSNGNFIPKDTSTLKK